jgi:hypothetical protein
MPASLYATLREIAEDAMDRGQSSWMQEGQIQQVLGDGMLVVTVGGKQKLAAPVNDAAFKAGDMAYISGAEGGPPVVHGQKF